MTATGHSCTPSAPTSVGDRRVREACVQPRDQAGGVGHRKELSNHGAGVPIHMPVPTLTVAPPRAPWDACDDEGGRACTRWRPDQHEGVFGWVVPVHARGHLDALGRGEVQLEGEAAARGPRGAEQPRRGWSNHRSHDACRQVEQTGEVRRVQDGGGDVGGAREHGDAGGGGRRQAPRKRHSGQRRLVSLVEPGEAIHVVGLEVLQHPRIVDRLVPLTPGLVGGQPMQRLRCVLNVGLASHAEQLRQTDRDRPRTLGRVRDHGVRGSHQRIVLRAE